MMIQLRNLSIIILVLFMNSCDMIDPHNSKPQYDHINEIHTIQKDGTKNKFISKGWRSHLIRTKNE